jgi:hypothetical protein
VEWLRFWEYSTADWAGLQFLVLVLAALVAWRQVREAQRQREDARRQREEQARPFVVMTLEVRNTVAEFRIENVGKTIARNVRFQFTPPIESSWDGDDGHVRLAETNLLRHGIPTLPPGKPVEALFDQLPARVSKDLPDDYEVTVSYEDPLGRTYSEPMTVGYSHLKDVGRLHRHDVHDIHREIRKIARELRRWTYMGNALRVMTGDDVKENHRQREEYFARKEAEAQAEADAAKADEVEQLGPTGFKAKSKRPK